MKVRVHQNKRMGGEVAVELDVVQSPAENEPTLAGVSGPPSPGTQSGIEMEKSLIVLESSGL